MKILFVSPTLPYPANDGGKIVILNTYNYLKKHSGNTDFIAIVKDKYPLIEESEFYKTNSPDLFFDEKISSTGRMIRNLLFNKPILIYKFYSPVFLKKLREKISTGNYDVIHFEGLHTAPYALKIKNETSAKIVLRLHNLESLIIKRFLENNNNILIKKALKREYNRISRFERKVFSELKNIIFITEDDKKLASIESIPGINPFVLNSGVDTDYFSSVKENSSNNLLYLGSMDWKPNEDSVLWFVDNVFSKLKNEIKDIKFYIVGKNPSEKIRSLNSDNIIVTGMVDDVREFIGKTGIAVIPIFIGGGMRIKILEIMAAGRPIISTSIGAEGINYKDKQNILIADSSEDFVSGIKEIIHDKILRNRLSAGGKQLVNDQYRWDTLILNLIKYYNSIEKR